MPKNRNYNIIISKLYSPIHQSFKDKEKVRTCYMILIFFHGFINILLMWSPLSTARMWIMRSFLCSSLFSQNKKLLCVIQVLLFNKSYICVIQKAIFIPKTTPKNSVLFFKKYDIYPWNLDRYFFWIFLNNEHHFIDVISELNKFYLS